MKQMIQRMREEKGGFTLAELLVVVAIVAVLVAIAIPVFTSSLDKANAQTDAANIRAGYGSASVLVLDSLPTTETTYTLCTDGSVYTGTIPTGKSNYSTVGSSNHLDNANESIGGVAASDINWARTATITYVYTPSATAGQDGTWDINASAENS